MQSEQRLHPLSIVFGFASALRHLVVPIFLAGALALRSADTPLGLTLVLIVALPFIPMAIAAVLRYHTFRYRYGQQEMVIRSGVLFRKERHIPYARIQNIGAVQNLVHRALGVATLRLDTGGGSEPEAVMSVVPVAAVEEMRRRVFEGKKAVAGAAVRAGEFEAGGAGSATAVAMSDRAEEPGVVGRAGADGMAGPAAMAGPGEGHLLLALPPRELLLSGFILSRGLVVIAAGLGYLWSNGFLNDLGERLIGEDHAGYAALEGYVSRLIADGRVLEGVALALLAIALLSLLLRCLSALWSAIRLFDFRLTRIGEDLRAEHGLLTRVTANIPLRRVQTLTVREGVLHRHFRRASVRVSTAQGVSVAGTVRHEWLAPLVRSEKLPELVQEVLSEVDLPSVEWKGVHPRAFLRAFRAPVLLAFALSLGLWWVVGWAAGLILLLLVAFAFVRARLTIARLGWAIYGGALVFRSGWLTTHTSIARFTRIQGVGLRESLFDRRFGMARVVVDTAGAGTMGHSLVIPWLPRDVALELHAFLARQAERTELRW